MSYTFFDHTGDIGVDLAAPTREGIFSEAALALAEAISDTKEVQPRTTRSIVVEADCASDLLNRFLSALLVIFDEERLLLPFVAIHELADRAVRATAGGEAYNDARHEGRTELKAVTWHELSIESAASGWKARVVFDV